VKPVYWLGRFLELLGLLILPSAIWITEVLRNETQALAVFFGGVALFFAGWLLTKIR
jgi:thiol:disulfide interchange protein